MKYQQLALHRFYAANIMTATLTSEQKKIKTKKKLLKTKKKPLKLGSHRGLIEVVTPPPPKESHHVFLKFNLLASQLLKYI